MMNLGPWAISDMWQSVGVNHISALQLVIDGELRRWLDWQREYEQRVCGSLGMKDDAYQDEMRRG